MMILRGVTLFPTMIYGEGEGLWKISDENDIKHRGANHMKKTQDCLMLSKS